MRESDCPKVKLLLTLFDEASNQMMLYQEVTSTTGATEAVQTHQEFQIKMNFRGPKPHDQTPLKKSPSEKAVSRSGPEMLVEANQGRH